VLSDDVLVHEMRAKLAAKGYRFSSLAESIVTSPQFLNQRVSKRRRKK
jgi:ribose 1,5-bisphosphokinase PhnN